MAGFNSRQCINREAGAALLAFMLVVVVGAAFVLVSSLNANYRAYARKAISTRALSDAKAALIGYALRYPETHPGEGPGYLPCPDINNNGSAGGSCSLAGGTSIGRLPWKTLEINDLRDDAGQTLWYAVSDNYKNNPKGLPRLNSEAPGNFGVDGRSDIVAIIFAPGAPVAGQDRVAGPLAVANYLEGDNANGDTSFVSRGAGEFNDQLVVITRAELMGIVEQRVVNQLRNVLKQYYSTYGAYPWLAPFADPKAAFQELRGTHNGSNNSATLDDSVEDFNDWGIQPGDTVINITDGSMASVSTVAAHTLTLGGLVMGTENDFDNGDEYAVIPRANGALLVGMTTSGSSALTLNDSSKDFDQIGVSAGDIVEDLTDGSSGMVATVASTSLTVTALGGGTNNAFAAGDSYRIRSSHGVATSGSGGLTLVDSGKDFSALGIQAGDLLIDSTDGSSGRVRSVGSTSLTLEYLYHGASNSISAGDSYYLPRFNTDGASREGLLSFHQPGKAFATGFSMDWNLTGAAYVISSSATNLQSTYTTALQTFTRASAGASGTLSVAAGYGDCTWVVEKVVDCRGIHRGDYLEGTVTSGSNTYYLVDGNADFTTAGIKRGDVVDNYDDEENPDYGTADSGSSGGTLVDAGINFTNYSPYNYLVNNYDLATRLGISKAEGVITRILDANTMEVSSYPGGPAMDFQPGDSYAILQPDRAVVYSVDSSTQLRTKRLSSNSPDFDSGEYYRIKTAASKISGGIDSTYSSGYYLKDNSVDFDVQGVKVGDVVWNSSDGSNGSYGVITYVGGNWIGANLYGGSSNRFYSGDNYSVFYNYVNKRVYDLQPRFAGSSRVYAQSGLRKRDGCIGYEDGSGNPDCSTTATAQSATLQQNGTTPVVTVRDYDDSDNLIASGSVTVPVSGTASGSIRVSGLNYYLREADDELPQWFVENNWQRLIYAGYSSDYQPGGSGSCTPGTDCLDIQGRMNANNSQAVVLSAGAQLAGVTCPDSSAQDRTRGRLCDYFEGQNASSGDDTFSKDNTDTFNDRIISVNP